MTTLPKMRARYLDTETTGFKGSEIVELCVLDSKGRPLIDTLVRPVRAKAWPDAMHIHGITPAMVQDAPTLQDLIPALLEALTGHHLIVYNLDFDISFFPEEVVSAPKKMSCCMSRFAQHYGDWNEYHQSFRWQKLGTAAAYVEHQWSGDAHRARADADACRSVWRYLREHDRAERQALEQAAEGTPGFDT